METATMHQKLFDAWSPYFQRDPTDDDPQQWDDALRFMDYINNYPEMELQPITSQQLYQAIQKTKLASSRGGDGFSTLDLRRLPMILWEYMANIFKIIEQRKIWPEAWVLAKTLCLPKTSNPKTPLDIRPITVMSKMYRIWGKIRGGQVASHLANHVPKTIGGPCAQVSSELIALYTADRIEEALSNKEPLSGVVLDIVKCYNCTPRLPLKHLLLKLGIPHCIVETFFAAMTQLQRFFQICDTCGDAFPTTTGIVEGCGFAVPCMLAIGIWADAVTTHNNQDIENVMFADNWSLFHSQPNQLVRALKSLLTFLDKMKMVVAPRKSWMWSTSSLHRTQLARVSHQCQDIPIINESKDLGVDQNYTNKIVKKTWRARLTNVKNKLKATTKTKIPRAFTKTLAVNGALACGSYGSVCTFTSYSDHKLLRSAIAKATRKAGTGANPWLACNAIQQGIDPQYRDFCNRFSTWKRYLRLFPHRIPTMQQRFQQPISTSKTITGPVVAFRKAAQTIGMQIEIVDGHVVCRYNQIQLPIMTTPKKILNQVIQQPWDTFVAKNLSNRKDWDLGTIDTRINTIAYNKLQYREQGLMDAILTGKHITNELISKFQPCQDDKCVLCGQPDSRQHRFFQCSNLAPIRQKFKATLESVKKWNLTQQNFAMCPYHDLSYFFTETQNEPFEHKIPDYNEILQHLFVDGTAFFNDHPWLVTAGSAVVSSNPNTTMANVIIRKRVPGIIQNSYIGELYAILLAMNQAWRLIIYSDCQTLVEEIEYIVHHRVLPQKWQQVHPELWQLVVQHILRRSRNDIQIKKVAAHQNWQLITQSELRWQAYVNSCVDFQAKQSILQDNKDSYQARSQAYQKQNCLKQTAIQYYDYLTEISKIIVDSKPKKTHTREVRENQFDPQQHTLQCCEHATEDAIPQQPIELYHNFPWGPIFLWRIQKWAQALKWSHHDDQCTKDISDIELTADYILYTNSEPPVNLSKGKEKQYGSHARWALRDLNLEADALGTVQFSQHVQLFRRALQWMNNHPNFHLFPCLNKRKVDSLKPLGLSAWHRGYHCRPVLACGNATLQTLRDYFVTESGTRRDLSMPFPVSGQCLLQHPSEFCALNHWFLGSLIFDDVF